jgi:hypothetical protein
LTMMWEIILMSHRLFIVSISHLGRANGLF